VTGIVGRELGLALEVDSGQIANRVAILDALSRRTVTCPGSGSWGSIPNAAN
jgi:hypothetical protein